MKVKVVGICNVSYTSKKTNQLVEGKVIHFTRKAERDGDVGEVTDTVFISQKSDVIKQVPKINLGKEVDIFYNRYGSVEDIAVN